MKKIIIRILLFLSPFFLGGIALFIAPLDQNFAYHFVKGECSDKGSWIYDRMYRNEKPIDIALIGASHIANGVNDRQLENLLDSVCDKYLPVANIGYCRGGRDIQYVMMQALFEKKSPKLVIIDVGEDEAKKGHPVFPYLAKTPELLGSFVFFNRQFFSSLWKGLATRFEYVRYRIFKREENSPYNRAEFGYIGSPHVVDEKSLDENHRRWIKRLNRWKPEVIRNIELQYSKHYLRKMIDLTHSNQCQVLFLYFPETGSGLKNPMLKKYYDLLAPLLIIPEEITGDRNNWKDPSHFNNSGSDKTTVWLAKQISEIECL